MKVQPLVRVAVVLLLAVGSVTAAPISYEGTLAPGTPVTGSVSGSGWANEVALEVDFWRFMATAGDSVSLRGTRGNTNFDPALSLYFGVTTAEQALFLNDADWGGLIFLTFADDEISVPSSATGDPFLGSYRVPFTGNYTVAIGGFNSAGAGPFPYSLVVQVVPAPATALLLLTGLLPLAWSGRRRC